MNPQTPKWKESLHKPLVGGQTWHTVFWVVVSNIFYVHPYLGKIPNLTNIFQRGWNHQLDIHLGKLTWKPIEWRLDDSDILFKKGLIFRCSFAPWFFFFWGGVVELKENMVPFLLKFCFYVFLFQLAQWFHVPEVSLTKTKNPWFGLVVPLLGTVGYHRWGPPFVQFHCHWSWGHWRVFVESDVRCCRMKITQVFVIYCFKPFQNKQFSCWQSRFHQLRSNSHGFMSDTGWFPTKREPDNWVVVHCFFVRIE